MQIAIEFKPTFREHWTSVEFHLHKQKQGTLVLIGVFILAGFCWYGLYALNSQGRIAWIMAGAFTILAIVHVFQRVRFWNFWRTMPLLRLSRRLVFDESGIDITMESLVSKVGWDYYKWYSESKHLILLYAHKYSYNTIPKAAFTDESLKEFRELLARKLPKR